MQPWRLLRLALCAVFGAGLSCATTKPSPEERLSDLTLAQASTDAAAHRPQIPATSHSGIAPYAYGGQTFNAEWITCTRQAAKGTFLLMHRDEVGFDAARFCQGWIAQTFLAAGYDVGTVNRPGYGKSTGVPDFDGPQSLAAMDAGLKDAQAKITDLAPVSGLWGYSSGATAAALFAKSLSQIKYLVLGGGLYDFDAALQHTQSTLLRKRLDAIKLAEGAKGFDVRSVAYDVESLPGKIVLYHGKVDRVVPASQAIGLRDSLATMARDVNLQLLAGVDHDLPWAKHRQILEILLQSLTQPPTP